MTETDDYRTIMHDGCRCLWSCIDGAWRIEEQHADCPKHGWTDCELAAKTETNKTEREESAA